MSNLGIVLRVSLVAVVVSLFIFLSGSPQEIRSFAKGIGVDAPVIDNTTIIPYKKEFIPEASNLVLLSTNDQQTEGQPERLTLEKGSFYSFNSVVTSSYVATSMQAIMKLDQELEKGKPLYLVLNTPGGSIFSGLEFIDFLKGLDREVKTISLFSASMGFAFVQELGERIVTDNSLLMAHRSAGGVEGQFDGELESRYNMIKRKIDLLEIRAAKRLQIPVKDYRQKVLNEYWVHGFDAVGDKAADKNVRLKCGSSLSGTSVKQIPFVFGIILQVTFSDCPLIKEPLGITAKLPEESSKELVKQAKDLVNELHSSKETFFNDYVKTGRYKLFFK